MKKNEFIKQIRQKYKMSQKKFADYLEVSKSLVEKVEMGKSPATPENKYVKAVCALEGLDNEMFKFDEITDEILKEYELTKFSKAFRKFLYFTYVTFYNDVVIEYFIESFNEINSFKIKGVSYSENAPIIQKLLAFNLYDFDFEKEILKTYKKRFEQFDDKNLNYIFIQLLLAIKTSFKPSYFFDDLDLIMQKIKENITQIENFIYSHTPTASAIANNIGGIIYSNLVKKVYSLEDKGLPLTVENIKKLKKQKELEKIKDEVIQAPSDPKDKQICELLQYAPPAFKDKIIEKLLKFKDEVEDI